MGGTMHLVAEKSVKACPFLCFLEETLVYMKTHQVAQLIRGSAYKSFG